MGKNKTVQDEEYKFVQKRLGPLPLSTKARAITYLIHGSSWLNK